MPGPDFETERAALPRFKASPAVILPVSPICSENRAFFIIVGSEVKRAGAELRAIQLRFVGHPEAGDSFWTKTIAKGSLLPQRVTFRFVTIGNKIHIGSQRPGGSVTISDILGQLPMDQASASLLEETDAAPVRCLFRHLNDNRMPTYPASGMLFLGKALASDKLCPV